MIPMHRISYIRNLIFGDGEITAQKWLIDDCLQNHPACRPKYTTPFLPSRILDIRQYPVIRLLDTRSLSINDIQDQRYIALSYCWGPSMPEWGKTTSKNLSNRLAGIDIQTLPQTLKDTIDFTHYHRVPFLWLDALCIIQDDMEDWVHESSCMSEVYSRALITIAASASNNCQGGFLKASYSKADLPIPRRGGYGLEWDFQTQAEEPNPWVGSFLANPLFLRGWTFQERELSPSIIHYTRMHIVWECRERVCAWVRPLSRFSNPRVRPLNLNHWSVTWRLRCFDLPSDQGASVSKRPSGRALHDGVPPPPFESWRRMVETYSTRQFTVAKDKLPAIAGLADSIQKLAKCDYLAGLWRDALLRDLLWRRTGGEILHAEQEPGIYYAPSWSWAWTNFQISFRVRDDTDDAQIIEANVTPENSKANLTSARIRLRARVFDMKGNTTVARFYKDSELDHSYFRRDTGSKPDEVLTVCLLRTCKAVELKRGGRDGQQVIDQGWSGGGLGLILAATGGDVLEYRRVGFVDLMPLELFRDLDYKEISII